MYVCLCNAFTDVQVRGAVAGGCRSVSQIYDALGAKPECGRCIPMLREMVAQPAPPLRAGPGGD
ncbi:MAG: bacterioferritin-associated ferredoxin [Alphaproteobacteria bacterium]